MQNYTSRRQRRVIRKEMEFNLQQQPLRLQQFQHLLQQQQKQGFFSDFGNVPGIGTTVESFESVPTWARHAFLLYAPGIILPTALDPTNSSTTTLRPGLVMGIQSATGGWTNYSPTATDGSQVAQGILGVGLPLFDPSTGLTQTKTWGIIIGGPLQASQLIGLDNQARAQLSPRIIFDDNYIGNMRFPAQNFVTKVANYSLVATDNFTFFDNFGATVAVTFTLPPILNGYKFNFRARAAQNLLVTSNEGGNMEALNNLVANTVAYQTGSQIIGGEFEIFSTPNLKWIVRDLSAGSNTVTVS